MDSGHFLCAGGKLAGMKSTGVFLVGISMMGATAIVGTHLNELLHGSRVPIEWGGVLSYAIPCLIMFVVGCCILRWGRDDLER